MKLNFILVFLFILLSQNNFIYARIGESIKECEKRYGIPLSKEYERINNKDLILVRYEKYQFHINIIFMNNIAVMVEYSKIPSPYEMPHLTSEEIKSLLNSESSDYSWNKMDNSKDYSSDDNSIENRDDHYDDLRYERWVRSDHTVYAKYDNIEETLAFLNKDWIAFTSNYQSEKMKGF
ncbi:MAG: hypothetical protein ACYCVH_11070 [Ignavibacteriaceae bacterium]